MSTFLSQAHLARINREARVPAYDRHATRIGVVHFGPGAFHRVHQASYVDDLLHSDPHWGICAVSLRSSAVRDALAPQDGLYTLAVLDEQCTFRVMGSISELLVAAENPQAVFARLTASTTRIVTSTVTEKGYCLGADGTLDFTHSDIEHDLRAPRKPSSLIGYLVEGLRRRREARLEAFTVVCCDNLVDNGSRLQRAVVALAKEQSVELGAWIEGEVPFPRTMVDSITPATDDALRTRVERVLGVADRWPVQREAFVQWVIESDSRSRASLLESVGITFTDDVGAYDRAKLRLLNGAHSTLAYVGLLTGLETVAQALNDPHLAAFVRTLMIEDILPSTAAPPGLDLRDYIETILRRFRNPEIRHPLAQIAWDGSQKLPFRLFGTISDNLAAGRPIDRPCISVAAWMHFVRTRARQGLRVVDPLAEHLFAIGNACEGHAATDVRLFLELESVFPAALSADQRFTSAVRRAYDQLQDGCDLKRALR